MSSRSTSTAAAGTSPRASTTTARRRTAPCFATASMPRWSAAWKDTKRIAVKEMGLAVRAGEVPAAQGSSRSARSKARRRSKIRRPPTAKRNNAAFQLAWLKRMDTPIELNCLDFGGTVLNLFLPGEAFIEYQLAAQKMRPDAVVNVAAYGDDGPGYIPTAKAYPRRRLRTDRRARRAGSEEIMLKAMRKLLKAEGKGETNDESKSACAWR